MRSSTTTLIAAGRELAATVQCDDGVANAAIAEMTDRLEEQRDAIALALKLLDCCQPWSGEVLDAVSVLQGASDD